MKKAIAVLLLLAFPVFALSACSEPLPDTEYILPGVVTLFRRDDKSIKNYTLLYERDTLRIVYGDERETRVEFDRDGRLRKETFYSADGKVSSITEYAYDENGLLTEEKKTVRGSVFSRDVYEYDENGNQTAYISYDGDGKAQSKWETAYDADGNVIASLSYTDGKLDGKFEYAYDENGREMMWKWYDPDGRETVRVETAYDANGRKSTVARYESGEFRLYNEYVYSPEGWLTEIASYDEDGVRSVIETHTYDENGNQTGEAYYDGDGGVYSRCEYVCDETGRTVQEDNYYYGEYCGGFIWEYDEYGHVTKEISYAADREISSVYEAAPSVTVRITEAQMQAYWEYLRLHLQPQWMR